MPEASGARSRVGAWALLGLFALGMALAGWLDLLLRGAGRGDLAAWRAGSDLFGNLGLVSAAAVGAVVARRRPGNPVGWLLLAFALGTAVATVARGYLAYALLARPGALPGGHVAVVVGYALGDSGAPVALLALALLLTPTGRLPSPGWRWVARGLVAAAALNALGGPTDATPLDAPLDAVTSPLALAPRPGSPGALLLAGLGALAFALFVGSIVAGAASLVVRFVRARGVERQQLRWLAVVAALVPVAAVVALAGGVSGHPAVVRAAAGTVSWLVPLALGAAVLRYRLYDLDRIISRTLTYGLLTLLLGGGYGLAVLVLGQSVGGLGGRAPSWLVAGLTLAAAALFQPARGRIQAAVDRRFDRRRYDAARTIAAFSARLREQVELDSLTGALLAVAEETMQPTQASLWLPPAPQAGASSTSSAASRRLTGLSAR